MLLLPLALALVRPMARVSPIALAASEPGWDEFEAWMSRSKVDEATTAKRRPSWSGTAAGHQHAHFYSNSAKTWEALDAPPRLVESLASLGASRPSIAQAAAYRHITGGEDCIVHYPAGTGKTLAVVAPLVQRLWEWEASDGRPLPGQVRAIILVPTAELGQQVLEVARDVARGSIRASLATGEQHGLRSWVTQRERLSPGLDLLVATMGRLAAHLNPRGDLTPSFTLEGTRALIVDEADSLYHGDAPSWLQKKQADRLDRQEPPLAMWRWMRTELPAALEEEEADGHDDDDGAVDGMGVAGGVGCFTVLVAASLTESIEAEMRADVGPGLRVLRGRGVHTTRPGVTTTLVDCSEPLMDDDGHASLFEAKLDELVQRLPDASADDQGAAADAAARPARTLVLCNSATTCERLARSLHARLERGSARVLRFNGSQLPRQRRDALAAFRAPSEEAPGTPSTPRILVATGRAVKGLDFSELPPRTKGRVQRRAERAPAIDAGGVSHVLLFDFSPDVKAHIARVGFATRGDAPTARVTALAVNQQLPFAKAMLEQDKSGSAHGLE